MKSASKEYVEQIAHLLKQRRIAIGFKQTEASERSGISLGTLRKFEQSGEISLERFMKLCRVYRMDMHIMTAMQQRDWWALEEIERAESRKTVRSSTNE